MTARSITSANTSTTPRNPESRSSLSPKIQKVFMGYQRPSKTGAQFGFDKADRRVTVYYFYILDPAFGLGFIEDLQLFPVPAEDAGQRDEWAKRQAAVDGLVFTELANGFAACEAVGPVAGS